MPSDKLAERFSVVLAFGENEREMRTLAEGEGKDREDEGGVKGDCGVLKTKDTNQGKEKGNGGRRDDGNVGSTGVGEETRNVKMPRVDNTPGPGVSEQCGSEKREMSGVGVEKEARHAQTCSVDEITEEGNCSGYPENETEVVYSDEAYRTTMSQIMTLTRLFKQISTLNKQMCLEVRAISRFDRERFNVSGSLGGSNENDSSVPASSDPSSAHHDLREKDGRDSAGLKGKKEEGEKLEKTMSHETSSPTTSLEEGVRELVKAESEMFIDLFGMLGEVGVDTKRGDWLLARGQKREGGF
ncbi:hypothetical protein BDZ91DRAFT_821772 [Kalaharituber pfeilii]|nr:hypothetical protein BDZ91DRAFT_821772 [Kalaharituber pfeilii]